MGQTQTQSEQPAGTGAPAPSLFPPDLPDFTGRRGELTQLDALLDRTGAPVLVTVTGPAGAGKSALAVHGAHARAAQFPDGMLYVNLRRSDATARTPDDVLAELLRALGVAGSAIPESAAARESMYRARLAGRRVLVLLDNAASEDQVRPLLVGVPGCALVVTSRRRLSGLSGLSSPAGPAGPAGAGGLAGETLAGRGDVELGTLGDAEAVELLARVAGPDRIAADRDAATAVVRCCGGLPLALRVAGAKLAAHPDQTPRWLADLLADERRILDELRSGDLEVRASLALGYRGLDPEAARLFRLLSLVDATDVQAWTAGPLLSLPLGRAEDVMERLVEARMLEPAGRDVSGHMRYRMHDLMRAFARERAESDESEQSWRAALARLLGGWLTLAESGRRRLPPNPTRLFLHGPAQRWRFHPVESDVLLSDPRAWLEAERAALVSAVEQAARLGMDDLAWELAGCLGPFLALGFHLDDWRRTHEIGLEAARRAGRRDGELAILCWIGTLHQFRDRPAEALAYHKAALAGFRELGWEHAEAVALAEVATTHRAQGRIAQALSCLERALGVHRRLGDYVGEVHALWGIAQLDRQQGRLADAATRFEMALALCPEAGDLIGEANALRGLGLVRWEEGRLELAAEILRRAAVAFTAYGDRPGEVMALLNLGQVQFDRGELDEARELLEDSLRACRDLPYRFGAATALRALGELRLARGELEAARAELEESRSILDELAMPMEHAKTLITLGRLYRARGEDEAARAAWLRALSITKELRAAPQIEQLAAMLADLTPANHR